MVDEALLLSSRPPSRTQVRTVVAFALLLFAAFLVSLPFRTHLAARNYYLIPIFFSTSLVGNALTATLLYSQAAIIRSRGLIALATGYLFPALMVIPHGLAYPHGFSEEGLLPAGLSTPGWMYLFAFTAFPIGVLSYVALKSTDATQTMRPEQTRSSIIICMAGCALLVTLLAIVATIGEPWLPQLITNALTWGTSWFWLSSVPLVLMITALAALLRRKASVLDLWLALVIWSRVIQFVLDLIGRGRFTVGWYLSSALGDLSCLFVLALLLAESNRLYARLAVLVSAQHRERDGRLLTMNAVAAAMAHEVKQPLQGILLNASAGLRTVQNAPPDLGEIAEILQSIKQDGRRVAEVVDSIRAMFAHRSSEKVQLDINELIRETTALMAAELTAWRVKLALTLDEQMPLLSVDRVQMKHVFLNLVANAIEAMTSVRDRPRMLIIRSTSSNAGVQVAVEDSGSRIDVGHSDRIFDPFFTTKPHGTGMGLSLCRSIVEGHGGRVWVTTDQPFGATFHVQLRRPIEQPLESRTLAEAIGTPPGRGTANVPDRRDLPPLMTADRIDVDSDSSF